MARAEALEQVIQVVGQAPAAFNLTGSYQTRWWLDGVRQAVDWLHDCCLATVSKTLWACGIRLRRGRRHVHSPDPLYAEKIARIATITWYSRQDPAHTVRLYQDEVTYYRRASVAQGYTLTRVQPQPLAHQGVGANTMRRIAGCLDAATGQLFAWQRAHFDRHTLLHFYQEVEAAYPQADQLFLIQDNWPVHWHADIREGLRGSKFTLVFLPTYAPWTNPIEKVWRKLYAEVLHLHPWADQWDLAQQAVQRWLDHAAAPSLDLMRYTGLLCSA
ncbi:MAG TPA: transposase [Ktedonobacterales bacterium]|nr:transposase [Ktedonobacterales bacterium]